MRRLWIGMVLTATMIAATAPTLGQAVQRIVAVVNNDVVSQHDLQNRIDLLIATANVPDTPEARQQLSGEVLQTLIVDRLKAQEARRLNITVSQEEVDRALTQIAAQLRVQPQQLKPLLEQRGAKLSTLIEQVETDIAWGKAVQRTAANQVVIGEDEIDAEAGRRLQTPGGPEFRVAEIFLPVESRSDENAVQLQAQRLIEELRRGASFPTLARTFSQGPTASAGGDLGWVRRGQLDPELDKYLEDLDRGELIGPLKTADGFRLLLMIDKRQGVEGKEGHSVLTVLQVFAPLPRQVSGAQTAATADVMRRLASGSSSCAEVETRNRGLPSPLQTNTSQVAIRDLPSELRPLVTPLKVGEAAGPLQVTNGLLLLVLCERSAPIASPEAREAARQQLAQERLAEASQRLLRELRRKALIDMRS
ncbi:MAG: peptidylprolyl isomerase [Rhodospirillales bacterium]|nr:peptidylprolyl isomerase [Rhodospirillales bacterium]